MINPSRKFVVTERHDEFEIFDKTFDPQGEN